MLRNWQQTLRHLSADATVFFLNIVVSSFPWFFLFLFSLLVMSNSLRPHELQHTRLLCPWDSPGQNTGVGCHFLLHTIILENENVSHSVVSNSLQSHGLQPARLLYPWNSPGKNTGVDCHSLLQGIFPTQELNLSLLHCRWILYQLTATNKHDLLQKQKIL